MEGRTVSHYRVVERLGGGGMGVVYKAIDTRLDRPVALKFLPPELTRDDDARQRLVQEAKTASALDHPNICTVHDIDSTPEGQLFIAMTFYDGETLKKHVARGPAPIQEAIDFAVQAAHGLAKAHEAGIIHRDIKPANLMITRDGVVKIVDFGIAKLTGQTGPTQTGTILGTVGYMSPEQIAGVGIDSRTDVWSLGAVLYEMLAGRAPFEAEQPAALMNHIANRDPPSLTSVRADVPDALGRIVDRALRKKREERYATAGELAQELTECRARLSKSAVASEPLWRTLTRPQIAAAVLLVIGSIGGAAVWSVNRTAKIRWAREQVLPEISRLIEQDKVAPAFALAEQIEPYLAGDSGLQVLWPRISKTINIVTRPPGARVYTKDYSDINDQWRDLGSTPLENVRLPVGLRRWKFTKDEMGTVELALPLGPFYRDKLEISLEGAADANMVHVAGGNVRSWITGIDPIESVSLPDFDIDKYEVTNRQFRAFVQAGGYRNGDYWDQLFADNGRTLTQEQAMARFVDATGRPGPSTWRLGDYTSGQDDYPVTGVSWYEAAAFAKFSGKSLPTVPHWIVAAGTDFGAAIVPLSNLQGPGPGLVGKYGGMGPFGTYDMAGNAREWCWNAWGNSRYILGGAWTDPQYMFSYANVQSPFDRSQTNGIRLVRYNGGMPEAAARPVELLVRDYAKDKPVSSELFNVYRSQFSYDSTPLNLKVEQVPGGKDFRAEKVTFDAAYGRDKVIAYLLLPTNGTPPYQGVVAFPGSFAISTPSMSVSDTADLADFVLKSGRALIMPVYRGTFERREGLTSTWPDQSHRYAEFVVSWVRDVRRTIDYLETRRDIDIARLAYFGFSWGGRMGAIIPAVEPRLKAAILNSAGLASGRAQPEVDQLNYVTRVTQPVLMLNGKYDAIEPVDTAQRPMFESLGSPKDQKKWVVYDDGHGAPAHRNESAREALAWLDKYLGPVN